MARRKTKRFRKKFKKSRRFSGKLKQKVRGYVKRYKRRIFKRRVMKQSELKWVYGAGTIGPKSVSSILSITDYCLLMNNFLYIAPGTARNNRIGKKYFVNSITFRFSYGNDNSANGISGAISLCHIKDKFKDGIKNNTGSALSTAGMNTQGSPVGWTKEYPKLGFYSMKTHTQRVDLANSTTVGVGFDQGQKRTCYWQLKVPINKEIKLTEDSINGVELLEQYIWLTYYVSPYAHVVGTVPDAKYNYYLTFYDL